MLTAFTDRTWLWASAGLYLAGFALGTLALRRNGRPAGAGIYVLLAIGYALQLAGLGIRGNAVRGCPLGNQFELYQFTAWSAMTLYLMVGVTFRHSILGWLTSALTASLTIVSLAIPSWDATQRTHIFGSNPWIELHAALAVFSYGVFALLALTSLMFLVRHRSLKAKETGGLFALLPSIRDLDHIGVRLLGAGVSILTLALAVIAAFFFRDTAAANASKILATSLVWMAYLVMLGLRLRGRLIAQRFAWAGIVLFAAALLSLSFVDGSRHGASARLEVRTP